MGRPVSLNMRNYPLPATVKAWIISDTDLDARSVKVVE
jgi:hypothetical protein